MTELPIWIVRAARVGLVALGLGVTAPVSVDAALDSAGRPARALHPSRDDEAPLATPASSVARLSHSGRWRELPVTRDGALTARVRHALSVAGPKPTAMSMGDARVGAGDATALSYDAQAPPSLRCA